MRCFRGGCTTIAEGPQRLHGAKEIPDWDPAGASTAGQCSETAVWSMTAAALHLGKGPPPSESNRGSVDYSA